MLGWTINHLPNVREPQLADQWGLLHEIGHNMQEGAWTLRGQGEVRKHSGKLAVNFHYHFPIAVMIHFEKKKAKEEFMISIEKSIFDTKLYMLNPLCKII